MIQVIGLGAGGHAKVIIELIKSLDKYQVVGLLDSDSELWKKEIEGIPVIGGDDHLTEVFSMGVQHAFIGLGSVGDTNPRKRLFKKAKKNGFQVIDVIHPQSIVSPSVELDEGIAIMAGAVINTGSILGKNVLINSGALVEHDCWVGSHVHVATGAHIAGGVKLEDGVHVGIGASILQKVCVGKNAIIGAGSVVLKDISEGEVVIGVPANPMKGKADG